MATSGSGEQPQLPRGGKTQMLKSTLTLDATAPRPYLPQSASQVDFQVPLLPYERMQEAIVSARLIGGPGARSHVDNGPPIAGPQPPPTASSKADQRTATADELMCGGVVPPLLSATPAAELVSGSRRAGGNQQQQQQQWQSRSGIADDGSAGQAPAEALRREPSAADNGADPAGAMVLQGSKEKAAADECRKASPLLVLNVPSKY